MRKLFFIIICFCFFPTLFGQDKDIKINNHDFRFHQYRNDKDEETDEEYEKVDIYRGTKKLLTHTLSAQWGDCNSISIELGDFEIKGDSLIFYSYWALHGDAPVSPYGVRKQIYQVKENGRLNLLGGKIYLEETRPGWAKEDHEGVNYLEEPPKNEGEQKALDKYKKAIEEEYHASFVAANEKDSLFREVKTKLKTKIDKYTSNWAEWEIMNMDKH